MTILNTKRIQFGTQPATVEFKAVDESWSPVTHQVTIQVDNGAAYGRSGHPTFIRVANFLDYDEAKKSFDRCGTV